MSCGKVSLSAVVFLMIFTFIISMLLNYFVFPYIAESGFSSLFKGLIAAFLVLIGATVGMRLFPKKVN